MASLVTFLFLTVSLLLHLYVSTTSSHIVLPLTHSLSKTHFKTTPHLLKSSSLRSTTRFHRKHQHTHHQNTQISLPLSPGSDYTLSFSLGTNPVQQISLYMDTGSDLVWFPCAPFECILCEGKYDTAAANAPPNISATSFVPCKSRSCSAAHSSLPSSDLCAISKCPLETIETSDCSSFACPPFYYAYGDGSLIARLYRETLSIPPSLSMPHFTFGCAHTTLGEPIGVAGFGRGLLSLPAQLMNLSPQLGNRFSYCLIAHSFDVSRMHRPSPLILGRNLLSNDKREENLGNVGEGFIYTPMLDNPKHPYYYCVGLEAISVGNKRIPAPKNMKRVYKNGNGGMVVDSGTTFTMLPTKLYEDVVTEFSRRVDRVYERATTVEEQTGLSPCYYYDGSVSKIGKVPKVVLHFNGNASVVLPRRNYFYGFMESENRKAGCLMVMNGGDDMGPGPAGLLGNYQQQGFEVVYDLEKERVGFARKQCSALWDDLNRT